MQKEEEEEYVRVYIDCTDIKHHVEELSKLLYSSKLQKWARFRTLGEVRNGREYDNISDPSLVEKKYKNCIENIYCQGKRVYLQLQRKVTFCGKIFSRQPDRNNKVLTFTLGSSIIKLYIDPSKFRILEDEEAFKYEVERWYAPDLMGYNRLTESLWLERYAKIPTVHRLGNALRDQFYLVSGLGRPLISQILYEAKLDPLMRCSALKEEERIELFRICQTVVREVYEGKKKRFMPDDQKDVFGNEISFVNMKKNRKIWVVRAVQKAVEKPKAKVKTNTD